MLSVGCVGLLFGRSGVLRLVGSGLGFPRIGLAVRACFAFISSSPLPSANLLAGDIAVFVGARLLPAATQRLDRIVFVLRRLARPHAVHGAFLLRPARICLACPNASRSSQK